MNGDLAPIPLDSDAQEVLDGVLTLAEALHLAAPEAATIYNVPVDLHTLEIPTLADAAALMQQGAARLATLVTGTDAEVTPEVGSLRRQLHEVAAAVNARNTELAADDPEDAAEARSAEEMTPALSRGIALEAMISTAIGLAAVPGDVPPTPSPEAARLLGAQVLETLLDAGLCEEAPEKEVPPEFLVRLHADDAPKTEAFRLQVDELMSAWIMALNEQGAAKSASSGSYRGGSGGGQRQRKRQRKRR
jgi:hypothetical protein